MKTGNQIVELYENQSYDDPDNILHLDEMIDEALDEARNDALNENMIFTKGEMDLFREWFDTVQDTNPSYLDEKDFSLARKLYGALNLRVPSAIITKK